MDALLAKVQADEPITTPERRQLAGIVQSFAHIVELGRRALSPPS